MKIKKWITLTLTCICAASSTVYAGDISDSTVVITDAEDPQIENSGTESETSLTEESAETSAVDPTSEMSDVEFEAYDPLSEISLNEESVGAVTYRSVYEPGFAEALYPRRDRDFLIPNQIKFR